MAGFRPEMGEREKSLLAQTDGSRSTPKITSLTTCYPDLLSSKMDLICIKTDNSRGAGAIPALEGGKKRFRAARQWWCTL